MFILWLNNVYNQSYLVHHMITGFWEADVSFCQESGVDMFCIYFDKDINTNCERACYILSKNGDDIVLNEPVVASISMHWLKACNWYPNLHEPKYLGIEFKNLSEDCIDEFPASQTMRIYPLINKMVLFYDDTITAVLYKNSANSELEHLVKKE